MAAKKAAKKTTAEKKSATKSKSPGKGRVHTLKTGYRPKQKNRKWLADSPAGRILAAASGGV